MDVMRYLLNGVTLLRATRKKHLSQNLLTTFWPCLNIDIDPTECSNHRIKTASKQASRKKISKNEKCKRWQATESIKIVCENAQITLFTCYHIHNFYVLFDILFLFVHYDARVVSFFVCFLSVFLYLKLIRLHNFFCCCCYCAISFSSNSIRKGTHSRLWLVFLTWLLSLQLLVLLLFDAFVVVARYRFVLRIFSIRVYLKIYFICFNALR